MNPSDTEVAQYEVVEIALGTAPETDMPFTMDVVFIDPAGQERVVPAYMTCGEWRVRYSSEHPGLHSYRSISSDGNSISYAGVVVITESSNSHGPLRVANDQRHLEHADGTPFLWLADTWWHGFVDRVSDEEFSELAQMRRRQGFSVVQIVAGLYPEMSPFASGGRSKSGWAWHENFTAPNFAWFDEADWRIGKLLEHDLVPCIVGSWSRYLNDMDTSQLLRHWREMIARWGAYPVVWCLVGEPPTPIPTKDVWWMDRNENVPNFARSGYGNPGTERSDDDIKEEIYSKTKSHVSELLKKLNELARGVRQLEPFGRPITIHSVADRPWLSLENEGVVDFWLQQTGHTRPDILAESVRDIQGTLAHRPPKPTINGEPCYEGFCGANWQDTQRFLFWSHMLSGTAGHTYGAAGVWLFADTKFPGFASGRTTYWKEAANFLGASHVGIGRKILLDLPWSKFEPHPEWVDPHQAYDNLLLPYAAGLDEGPRLVYVPRIGLTRPHIIAVRLNNLGDQSWLVQPIDPCTGTKEPSFSVSPDAGGSAIVRREIGVNGPLPSWADWLLLLRPAV